jgi:hypothetical protein
MIDKTKAILSLKPNAEFVVRGETIEWLDKKQTQPTNSQIDAEVKRLQAEYDAKAQLDDLYKAGAFSDDMTAKIQAVKDKYPKG